MISILAHILLIWTIIGGIAYIYLSIKKPVDTMSKSMCCLVTLACGPGAAMMVVAKMLDENLKNERNN